MKEPRILPAVASSINERAFELRLPTQLFDDWIRDVFPRFQRDNRKASSAPLLIDISACEWASPLPILAIATEVMSFSSPGRVVEIDLGEGASTDAGALLRRRTLKYLSLHGFLNAFFTRADLNVRIQFDRTAETGTDGKWYSGLGELPILRDILERTHVELIYGDTTVIPAMTWALPDVSAFHSEAIRLKVRELLKHADSALFGFKADARKYRDVALQRMNQVLLELVENAAEHAYDSGGFVGLYARVRESTHEGVTSARATEMGKSPLLSKVLLSEKQRQIELFVLDVGKGLFSSIADWKKLHGTDDALHAVPLRRTASVLFSSALSRHDRSIDSILQLRGGSTGLIHLDAILRHRNDSTRIITGREWLAGPHPRPPGFRDSSVSSGGYLLQPEKIAGTFFHVGISPVVVPNLNERWFSSEKEESANTRRKTIRNFAHVTHASDLISRVIDIRNGDGISAVGEKVETTAKTTSKTIVRAKRILDKNLVNQIVLRWVRGHAQLKEGDPILYLCDLGRYQAVDTLWVIEQLFPPRERYEFDGCPRDSAIFLVTEDLCCTELKVSCKSRPDGRYSVQIERPTSAIENLENHFVYLLQQLRICDSAAFWLRVSSLAQANATEPTPARLERVEWPTPDGNKVLPYYLNFSALVQDADAARCIRRSLRRILALFPTANDYPLDTLVQSALHDAKKWLIRPQVDTSEVVLIGSLSVSGSTLTRFVMPASATIKGIVDCIGSPYFDFRSTIGDAPHLTALLWDPALPTTTNQPALFRRHGRSAHVEAISRQRDPMVYDEPLYEELETANLVKVGHWRYGDRDSLLELNAEAAIEQSAASESGAITSIVRKLVTLARDRHVILAFPVDKLAYRLAHHVRLRLQRSEQDSGKDVTLLPLSFMPRFAGGLTRFAPLVIDAARALADTARQTPTCAVFIDFGFITNRTMRHAVRQLKDAGFDDVRALGLLNRSSAPELKSERTSSSSVAREFPDAHWRWNVPVLGTGPHCPLCAALPLLGRLRRSVGESHKDLVQPLSEIVEAWRARDITDFWDEFGLVPLSLSDAMRKSLAAPLVEIGASTAYTSSTLSARAIEYLRATGDSDTPLRFAAALLKTNGEEQATELICTVVLLAGGGFSSTDSHVYMAQLVRAVVGLISGEVTSARQTKLLGLVAIVFAMQSTACKLSVLEQLRSHLRDVDVTSSPALRLALMALTTDYDVSTKVEAEFKRLCGGHEPDLQLTRNYHALRPVSGTPRDSWDNLHQAFGRSPEHSQASELGNLRSSYERLGKKFDPSRHLVRLAGLLGQCDQQFVIASLGVDLQEVIEKIRSLKATMAENDVLARDFADKVANTFGHISGRLHSVLKRYGERASKFVYEAFYDVLKQQASESKLELFSDILLTKVAMEEVWPTGIGDYFALDDHVCRLFGEIFTNIRGKSVLRNPPQVEQAFNGTSESALGWVWFDRDVEPLRSGLTVVFVTGLIDDKVVEKFRPKVTGLDEFGVQVSSRQFDDHGNFFEIRVRIPSLASILGTS